MVGSAHPTRFPNLFCFYLDSILFQYIPYRIGGLGALSEPVLDSFLLELDILRTLFGKGIVVSQFLDHATIAGTAALDRIDPIERPMPTPHPFHPDFHHLVILLTFLSILLRFFFSLTHIH
jgi:hypothetical protein